MSDLEKGHNGAETLPNEFIDLFDGSPAFARDPYAFYQTAKAWGRIVCEPHHGIYLVTHYADILEIKRRTEDFSACVAALGPHAMPDLPERPAFSACPFGYADMSAELADWRKTTSLHLAPLLTLDPPSHSDLRGIVNRLFTASRQEAVAPRLRSHAADFVSAFLGDGEVEWVSGFATPFTYFAINEAMDIPAEDQERQRQSFFATRSARKELVRDGTVPQLDESDPLAINKERWRQYLVERRHQPTGDLLSQIATAPLTSGKPTSIDDLIGIANIMFVAGQDTTRDLIANGMQILATRPALQERLRDHPNEINNFIAEVLRFDPPVQGLFRYCVKDAVVNGVSIPAGAVLWLIYGAANRDPAVFERADVFDPGRSGANKALTFGYGPHFCPGQPLAKLEARIAFTEALSRMRNIRLRDTGHDVPYRKWFVEHAPERVDLVFDVA